MLPQLVCAHAKMMAAYEAQHRNELRKMDVEDLLFVACHGLGLAVYQFDPEGPHDFSTMASWYIRDAFGKTVRSGQIPTPDPLPTRRATERSRRSNRRARTMDLLQEIEDIAEWRQESVSDTLIDELRTRTDGGVSFSLVLAVTARHFGMTPHTILTRRGGEVGKRAYRIVMLLGNECAGTVFMDLAQHFGCEPSHAGDNILAIRAHLGNPLIRADLETVCHELGVPMPEPKNEKTPDA